MKFKPVQQMNVYLHLEGNEKRLGTLAWSGKDTAGLHRSVGKD